MTMNQPAIDYIKETTSGFLGSWPLEFEVTITEKDSFIIVDIKTDKDFIFIQPNSDPLLAIQYLLRLMVKKRFPTDFIPLSVNIGDFHRLQQESLIKLAREAIIRAKRSSDPVRLPSMSSFERRVIHLYVAGESNVASESVGAGSNRRVVIKASTEG